jgi:hypothetical protein
MLARICKPIDRGLGCDTHAPFWHDLQGGLSEA